MNKNYTKQIISGAKIVILALFVAIGMNYAFAFVGPTAGAPGENVAAPINTSSANQVKDIGGCTATACGGISVGTFVANKAAQFFDIILGDPADEYNVTFGSSAGLGQRANVKVFGDGYFVNRSGHNTNVGIGTSAPDVNTGLTIDLTGRSTAAGTDAIKLISTGTATASNIVINKSNFGVWSQAANDWANGFLGNLTLSKLDEADNGSITYPATACIDSSGKVTLGNCTTPLHSHITTVTQSYGNPLEPKTKSCPASNPHVISGGVECSNGGVISGNIVTSRPSDGGGGWTGWCGSGGGQDMDIWAICVDDSEVSSADDGVGGGGDMDITLNYGTFTAFCTYEERTWTTTVTGAPGAVTYSWDVDYSDAPAPIVTTTSPYSSSAPKVRTYRNNADNLNTTATVNVTATSGGETATDSYTLTVTSQDYYEATDGGPNTFTCD